MSSNVVEVRWETASDEDSRNVVQSGTEIAPAKEAHSVLVAPYRLWSARYFWYRFEASDEISSVGRTKTPPEIGTPLSSVAFAFASCANQQEGYFPAYRAITEEEDGTRHFPNCCKSSAGILCLDA